MSFSKFLSPAVGNKLRDLRYQHGITNAKDLSGLMKGAYSPEIITRRESGKIKIDDVYLKTFCDSLGLEGAERDTVMNHAKTEWLRQKGDTEALAEECWALRRKARSVDIYSATHIPSGLQTFEYAKALFEASAKVKNIDEAVRRRLEWAQQQQEDATKTTRMVFLENALYVPTGSPHIMAQQIAKLAEFQDAKNFQLRILPREAYLKIPLQELFVIVDNEYCVCDNRIGFLTTEDARTVEHLAKDFEALFSNAVSGLERKKIIQRAVIYRGEQPVTIDGVYADFLAAKNISSAEQIIS